MSFLFSRKASIESSCVLRGATDSHSHILFGVDDGIQTLDDSLAALDYLERQGVRTVWLTPHVMEEVENTTAALQARFGQLREAYTGGIDLHLGAEYMMDTVFVDRLAARDLLTVGDNMVMIETRYGQQPLEFEKLLAATRSAGYHVLLAHPERYFYLIWDDYERIHASGVRFQLNLPSLCMQYGPVVYKKALWLLERRMYFAAGSDCHRLSRLQEQYLQRTLSKSALAGLNALLHP